MKEHQGFIARAELDSRKLLKTEASQADMGTFRNRLQALRAGNLGKAIFEERRGVIFELGAEVYFLEDLKSSRIAVAGES